MTAWIRFEQAREMMIAGNLKEALVMFGDVLDGGRLQDPFLAEKTHRWMGEINQRLGRMDEARVHTEQALAAVRQDLQRQEAGPLRRGEIFHLLSLAGLAKEEGRMGLARRHVAEARRSFDTALRIQPHYTGKPLYEGLPWHLIDNFVDLRLQEIYFMDYEGAPLEALARLRGVMTFIRNVPSDAFFYRTGEHRMAIAWQHLAVKLDFLGYDEEALDTLKQLPELPPTAYWRDYAVLLEGHRLCLARAVEGPGEDDLKAMDALIARIRDGAGAEVIRTSLLVHRAALLQDMGRHEEALRDVNALMEDPGATPSVRILARLRRFRICLEAGWLDGVEEDLEHLLQYYRAAGLKKCEPGLYASYAEWLRKKGRSEEAVAMLEESFRLSRSFGLSATALNALLELAAIRLAAGDAEALGAVWTRIDQYVAAHPELPPRKRLAVFKAALERDRLLGDAAGYANAFGALQRYLADAPVTAYQRSLFASFPEQLPAFAPRAEPAAPPAVSAARPEADLQPLLYTTRVRTGDWARARFTLSNPTFSPCPGTVRVEGPGRWVEHGAARGELRIMLDRAGATGAWTRAVTLDPGAAVALYVEAQTPPSGRREERVSVRWDAEGAHASTWLMTAALELPEIIATGGQVVRSSPFYSVPVYQEIRSVHVAPRAVGVRIRSERACRAELYDAATGRALAIDANCDGDFEDSGDAVFTGQTGDGYPSMPVSSDRPAAVVLHVFHVQDPDPAPVHSLDLVLAIRDEEQGAWIDQTLTRILLE